MSGQMHATETVPFLRSEIVTEKRMSRPVPTEVLLLDLEFLLENGEWTGQCPALGVGGTGNPTIEGAREELTDLVVLYLDGLNQMEMLNDTLAQRGIRSYSLAERWPENEGGSFAAAELRLT